MVMAPIVEENVLPREFQPSHANDLRWYWGSMASELGLCSSYEFVESALAESQARKAAARAERARRKRENVLEEDVMPAKGTRSHFVDPDPDQIVKCIKQANHVRRALNVIGMRHTLVLHAAFGPMRGNPEENRWIRKRFFEVGEIAVVIHAIESQTTLFEARRTVCKIAERNQMTAILPLTRQAERMFYWPACRAYAEAIRCG